MQSKRDKAMWAKFHNQPQTTNKKVYGKFKTGLPLIAEAEFGFEISQEEFIKQKMERK